MITLPNSIIVKYQNEDFCVSEVSLIPADVSETPGHSPHTLLVVKKSGYTTFEAMQRLALFFNVDKRAVHCQGLKDEDGVTEQLLSIECIVSSERAVAFNAEHSELEKGFITITIRGYSPQPVQEKSLHGNVFKVTLRNLDEQQANNIQRFCSANPDFVCANYYDQQRFGLPEGPFVAHLIGEAIAQGDWEKAEERYRASGNAALDFPGQDTLPERALPDIDIRKLNFFLGAYASLQWNQALSTAAHSDTSFEIFENHTVKVLDATQPIPLSVPATGYTIDTNLAVTTRQKTRTSIVSTTVFAETSQPDKHFPGKQCLSLQFFLPTGSYATMLIKQLVLQALPHKNA